MLRGGIVILFKNFYDVGDMHSTSELYPSSMSYNFKYGAHCRTFGEGDN
jgi:hypothetical protein